MSQSLEDEFKAWIGDILDEEIVPPQTKEAAAAALRAYRADAAAGSAWTGLTKEDWCARIGLLLADPSILNQRPTGYCMPAACLYVLFKRVPAIMAEFCVGLARDGAGTIGDLHITMTPEIRAYDVASHAREKLEPIHPVDYVLFLAMQEEMSITDIEAPDSYAANPGLSLSNAEDLLAATDLFIVSRKNDPKVADFATLDGGTEAILFGSISLFSSALFPDHAVVLVPPLGVEGNQVTLRFWSWGMFQGQQTPAIEGGAYVTKVSKSVFEAKLDGVVFAKLKA